MNQTQLDLMNEEYRLEQLRKIAKGLTWGSKEHQRYTLRIAESKRIIKRLEGLLDD